MDAAQLQDHGRGLPGAGRGGAALRSARKLRRLRPLADPRNGIFAVILSIPWFFLIDIVLKGQSQGLGLFMAAAGIGINAGIIGLLCGKFGAGDKD